MLSADCQRILAAWVDRARLSQEALTCQEMAAGFGMEPVPAQVEALRSKAKWLVARGWAAGTRRAGSLSRRVWAGRPAGHEHGHRPVHHRLGGGGALLIIASLR